MAFSLLPIFIVENLKGGYKSFGLLEGAVLFLSFISKLFVGILIDISKKKLGFLKVGAFFTIISKIFITAAWNIWLIFIAKAIDRFVKGLRTTPADTMLAEIPIEKRGYAYSLRHMMNIAGSLIGSVITSFLTILLNDNFRVIFGLAIIPTVIAYVILKKKVKYQEYNSKKSSKNWNIKNVKDLRIEYWRFIIIIVILMFARFSEGFITLRARNIIPGNTASLPIFMGIYEICIILVAIPMGKLSDTFDKRKILLYGIFLLFIANIMAIFAHNNAMIVLVYIMAGIHIGSTHGVLSSIVSQLSTTPNMVGTTFAIYYAIEGICLFFSNYLAGVIGDYCSVYPFIQGGVTSILACVYIFFMIKNNRKLC
jgi:MFS family permease